MGNKPGRYMNRCDFLQMMGCVAGAAALPPACLGGLAEKGLSSAPIVPYLSAAGHRLLKVESILMESRFYDIHAEENGYHKYRQIVANSGKVTVRGRRTSAFHKVY